MIYSKFLKEQNIIGVPAVSAGSADKKRQRRLNNSIKRFENLNYKIDITNNAYTCINGRSATKEQRAKEFNEMIKKDDFIICLSGGEFLVEILDYIDFSLIKDNPKYVCGFSDPTGLLFPITTKYDIATIYGNNFSSLGAKVISKSDENFLEIIKGNIINQKSFPLYEETPKKRVTGLENYNLTKKVLWKTLNNEKVELSGRIIGGCFDIISELIGTKYDGMKEFNEKYKNDGIIWYFDNCELSYEETIRTLWKMNQFDYFKYTKCIIFGRFGKEQGNFYKNVKDCLKDSIINELNIPIIYNADISHKAPCLTIINGAICNLKVNKGKGNISFELR